MKKALTITIIILLFASLLAANEVNQSVEKVPSVGTKSLSTDGIITAFTFLLAALTVMATLFGIYIGYIGYKSGKEYEKEVAKAENAAKRAQDSAIRIEKILVDIQQRGDETITRIQNKFGEVFGSITAEKGTRETQQPELSQKLLELTKRVEERRKAEDYEGAANFLEAAVLFRENDAVLWGKLACILALGRKLRDAFDKINIAIEKDPNNSKLYVLKSMIRLDWTDHGGPMVPKSEIIQDVSTANKLGMKMELAKKLLESFLDADEYKEVFGTTKEEDGFGKE